ncbi:MAG TPA: TonB-dependent receptor [Usitatibacter sp.]|nr:TonB-dependent receptor [Usitatibacter sp.]
MKSHFAAGVAAASLAAQAQVAPAPIEKVSDPVVVTASRLATATVTLRDAVVITREDIDAAGPITLGELLQRKAGIELRETGGPGQPESLFIRGAGSAQTLVLVDGMRVGSATAGTTPVEHIPLEMIERIEVVKGPLSSLYGSDAIGGVIQVFTRGKTVPHLFATVGYGTDKDRRVSAGISTADQDTRVSLNAGYRAVDARSASNPASGSFVYNPDRDPFDNAFVNLHAAQRMWTGENIELDAFSSHARTHFDSGPSTDDLNVETVSGAKISSSMNVTDWWMSRLTIGEGDDKLVVTGSFPDRFETRQLQATWLNEMPLRDGRAVLGAETVRQKIVFDANATPFALDHRDTNSVFAGANESYAGQRLEASARRDEDSQFGTRNTGSASYGIELAPGALIAATYARGFRAPTFFDLYGPTSDFYHPNPDLLPETSKSYELSATLQDALGARWRLSAFDNRYDNLIAYDFTQLTVLNVARARARGIEMSVEASWLGARWRGAITAQRPRDEDTGLRLQGRAERYGSFEVDRAFGAWSAGLGVQASGPRFDSPNEDPATKLGGYAVVDLRLRYTVAKNWSVQLTAANIADRRYQDVVGYDKPRRSVLLGVTFESF